MREEAIRSGDQPKLSDVPYTGVILVAIIYRPWLCMEYHIWTLEQDMTQGLSGCCVRNKPCFRQTLESDVSNVPLEY
jgi:hypothetical protein